MELKFALNILYERRNTKDVTILLPLPPGGALPVIAEDRRRVDAILARMKRRDFLSPLAQDADQMTERAGKRLFMAVESNQIICFTIDRPTRVLKPIVLGLELTITFLFTCLSR